jgi:hypothetical protein
LSSLSWSKCLINSHISNKIRMIINQLLYIMIDHHHSFQIKYLIKNALVLLLPHLLPFNSHYYF